jgi:hypothetical protein
MHDQVRLSPGAYDQIINDVIPIIEEMLGHVEQRPDALTARSRFRAALDTARRMFYPTPFQVSPEPSPPPWSPAPDRHTLHATSSQNQPTTNEHRSDLTRAVPFATIPQVLYWIQGKKSKPFSPPTSPVLDDKLVILRGTDHVRTLVLTTHMN